MISPRPLVQLGLVVLVLAAGGFGAKLLTDMRKEPEPRAPELVVPTVRTLEAESTAHTVRVSTHGTVVPRTEGRLVAEISGRVLELSPALANGGFFEAGELLVRLDSTDYELALARAELEVASAERKLAEEEADADVARRDWERQREANPELGEPGALVLRTPQVAEARASLAAARAGLTIAERDVERSVVRAPYTGRVRTENVDVGDFVQRGAELARIYAVDFAEVRLPVADEELAFLDLPLGFRGEDRAGSGPAVLLTSQFAGRRHTWEGEVVRTEGEIDPRTRMVLLVARVEDPYGRGEDTSRPPLAVGMFVSAEIVGRTLEDVVVVPRDALRQNGEVFVLDDKSRLEIRRVEPLRSGSDFVVLDAGVDPGEQVVLTPIEIPVAGMRLAAESAELAQ